MFDPGCTLKSNNCTVDLSQRRHFYMSKQMAVKEGEGKTKTQMTHYYLIVVRNPGAALDLPNRAFAASLTRQSNQT